MLSLKTKTVLHSFEGKELIEGETKITIGLLLTNILSNATQNPHRAYILGREIATNDTVELKAEDVVFLKEVVSAYKNLGALYTGQIISILDGQ